MEEPKPLPPPHDLCRKEVRHFFETEQDAANGRAEGNGHSGRTRSTEDPATLAYRDASMSGSYGRCVYLPSFVSYLLKNLLTMLPTQEAMWTKGPSLPVEGQSDVNLGGRAEDGRCDIPRESPEATESASPTALVKSVRPPRYPWMTKPRANTFSDRTRYSIGPRLPERIVLISGIPLPAAWKGTMNKK